MTNLALSIFVARNASIEEFGAFTASYALYIFLTELWRAGLVEVLLISFSGQPRKALQRAASDMTGTALVGSGIVSLFLVMVTYTILPPSLDAYFYSLAAVTPGLLLQDSCRLALICDGRPQAAAGNDALWGGALALSFTFLIVGSASGWMYLMAWGLAATLAAVIGLVQLRVLPRVRHPLRWLRDHRRVSTAIVGDFLVEGGTLQLSLLAIGWLGGLSSLAAIGAARVVLGPVGVFVMFLGNVLTTEGARLYRASGGLAHAKLVNRFALGMALLPIPVVMGVLLLPHSLGEVFLGVSFLAAQIVILPLGLYYAGRGAQAAYRNGIRVAGRARWNVNLQVAAAPFFFIGVVAGTAAGEAAAAPAWAMAIVTVASVPMWQIAFSRSRSLGSTSDRSRINEGVEDGQI